MGVPEQVILSAFMLAAGWSWGAIWAKQLMVEHAERAVMQDHRVSMGRKAAIIARIRSCPVALVLEEMEAQRCRENG